MASLKYIADGNLQMVQLGADYAAGSGSMVLATGHGSRLPSAGDFWLATMTGTYRCYKVTARASDTLTTAAADGTADGALSAGQPLAWVLGKAALDQLRIDIAGMTSPLTDGAGNLVFAGGDIVMVVGA